VKNKIRPGQVLAIHGWVREILRDFDGSRQNGIIHPSFRREIERAEGWLSGLRHLTRNQAQGQPCRGFESLPFRHFASTATSSTWSETNVHGSFWIWSSNGFACSAAWNAVVV
jgi:hypothetical protein